MKSANSNNLDNNKEFEANKHEAEIIINELNKEGILLDSISDLKKQRHNYVKAIPILVYWLPRTTDPNIKITIVRTLSVPWVKGKDIQKLLISEFKNYQNDLIVKWVIGNALSIIADKSITNELFELIINKNYGKAREMLVIALGRMPKEEVEDFLIPLLKEDDLAGYALMALKKMNSQKGLPEIEKLTSHSQKWVRMEAKKAIDKIRGDKSYKEEDSLQ